MKIFLLDLMHDLREKRLWPVALVLLIALVAVPVVLSKPAPTPPPPAPAPQEARSEQDLKGLAKVVLAKQDEGKGSDLNLFDSTNPFKPPKSGKKKEKAATGTGSTGTGTGVGNAVTGGSEVGGLGGTGGGETTPVQPQTPSTTKPKTTQFTYVVDLKWTHGNKTRKVTGMQRLEMLPNENAPLLVFLGVDAKANNGVFLVDSRIKPTGEGKCKPSADDCSFLYLGPGSEELLTDADGNTYTLQILEIRKVEVKKKSSKAKAGSVKRSQASQKRAAAQQSSDQAESAGVQRRPFLPRLLNELVTVSSSDSAASRPGVPSR